MFGLSSGGSDTLTASTMRAMSLLLVAAALATAHTAAADEATQPAAATAVPPIKTEPAHEHPSLIDRPHTVAEAEVGIVALPSAPISPSNRGGATPLGAVGNGDATVQTGMHLIYRATREWAFGAGALFAPRPTSDPNAGGGSGLSRTHSRSYLFLGGEIRYFALRSRWFDGWFGLSSGAVIIADRFSTNNIPAVPSLLGTNTVTVSTEGVRHWSASGRKLPGERQLRHRPGAARRPAGSCRARSRSRRRPPAIPSAIAPR